MAETRQPLWPALLQQQGCDELQTLLSAADWQQLQDQSSHLLQQGELLLDSSLHQYSLTPELNWQYQSTLSTEQLSLMVGAHLAAQGQCCISKLRLDSMAAAIALIDAQDS
ncbi:DUF4144 family protein [Shewanella sp.]|uniref:DUF4144 family protein n=1 Tax=Shewanella sp. TaxID=50422 RepID=UPI0035676820